MRRRLWRTTTCGFLCTIIIHWFSVVAQDYPPTMTTTTTSSEASSRLTDQLVHEILAYHLMADEQEAEVCRVGVVINLV